MTIEELQNELKICLKFIEDVANNFKCDAEYSPDCTPCCADTILTRSKYYKPEKK